jgi:predicted nucleic acid-binding protein
MFVLDTNVISELIKPAPSLNVQDWLDQHAINLIFTTAITKAELHFGVLIHPDRKRREQLAIAIDEIFRSGFDTRILPFDSSSSEHYAEIASKRRLIGKPISNADAQIAAICRQHQMTLVTRNVNDFSECGISIINPFKAEI